MAFEADLELKVREGEAIEVSDGEGHWIVFSLDDLRHPFTVPRVDLIAGEPFADPADALQFVTVGHAMACEMAATRKMIPGP